MLYEILTGRVPLPVDDPFVVASAGTVGDPPAPRSLNPSVATMKDDLDHPERVMVSGLAGRLK